MPVDPERWKKVWDACPWATAFASPLWHAVTEEIEPQDACFEWKGIITPLRKIKLAKGFIRGYESTVPGVAAGPVSRETPDDQTIDEYWQELNRRTSGRFLVHLRPDSPFIRTEFKKLAIPTHLAKIKERKERISRHHRRKIKKAQEAGIRVSPARRETDFEAYMEMYEASLKRWRKRPARVYSKEFFDRAREVLLPADAACFFMAWDAELPQAGAFLLYETKRTVYWHGVSVERPAAGAAHLLHWAIMEDSERRGMEEYDFGPSPGLLGVERFKQGFGTQTEDQITVLGPAKLFSSYFLKRTNR